MRVYIRLPVIANIWWFNCVTELFKLRSHLLHYDFQEVLFVCLFFVCFYFIYSKNFLIPFLRLLTAFLLLIWSLMYDATFNLFTLANYRIFGTLKDGSLQIYNLSFDNYFSYSNVFQNGVRFLS